MTLSKSQLIAIGVVGFFIILFALIFTCTIPGLQSCKKPADKIEGSLSIWGVYDLQNAFDPAISAFKLKYPGVNITYKRFNEEKEYEEALLEAFATGKGPDVFMVKNNSLLRSASKIQPFSKTKFSLIDLRNLFPQVVEYDFAPQGTVFALPIFLDTLSLFYNRDIFNQTSSQPPTNWEDFQNLVQKISTIDTSTKNITRAGASIGGSARTIENSSDILSLLMLQSGTKMVSNDFKSATFASKEGEGALKFYTSFANAKNSSYSWNDSMPQSRDAFSSGITGMIFDYASSINLIKEKNAFLNFSIAPVPQPKNASVQVAYPKYFGFAVSRQSKFQNIAWDFIISATTKPETASKYSEITKKPPALLSLITGEYSTNPDFYVFAKQATIARSWPQVNEETIKNAFSRAIELVNTNQSSAEEALREAEQTVTEKMSKLVF